MGKVKNKAVCCDMGTAFKDMTYKQMADMVSAISIEVKRRNPIMVNWYMLPITTAIIALQEISAGEAYNFTSECGPKE